MSRLQSYLGRACGRTPTDESQLRAMKASLFHSRQILCLDLSEVRDPIIRQAIVNEGERQFGKLDAEAARRLRGEL